jgi:hypothetical protein
MNLYTIDGDESLNTSSLEFYALLLRCCNFYTAFKASSPILFKRESSFKGIVQRKLTGVKSGANR